MAHETVPVQVWADVDVGVAEMVRDLNTITGVRTISSCQGTLDEGGGLPPTVMASWTPDALAHMRSEGYNVTPWGDGTWGYVCPPGHVYWGENEHSAN